MKVLEDVRKLVAEELERANGKYPLFASKHEGYAVLLEEVEEAEAEMNVVRNNLKLVWQHEVKHDWPHCKNVVMNIKAAALRGAAEFIQVAAMAEKYEMSIGDKHEK